MAGSRVGLFDNFNILGNSRTTSTENCARLSKSERMRGRKRGLTRADPALASAAALGAGPSHFWTQRERHAAPDATKRAVALTIKPCIKYVA